MAMKSKSHSLPKNSIVVTFDDGHSSNYELLNIFKKYEIRPTIYLCTGVIKNNDRYWWSGIVKSIVESLTKIPNQDRLARLKETPRAEAILIREPLSKNQILEMKDVVEFGNHTRNHPIVTQLSEDLSAIKV